jgi:hypothetical protein
MELTEQQLSEEGCKVSLFSIVESIHLNVGNTERHLMREFDSYKLKKKPTFSLHWEYPKGSLPVN